MLVGYGISANLTFSILDLCLIHALMTWTGKFRVSHLQKTLVLNVRRLSWRPPGPRSSGWQGEMAGFVQCPPAAPCIGRTLSELDHKRCRASAFTEHQSTGLQACLRLSMHCRTRHVVTIRSGLASPLSWRSLNEATATAWTSGLGQSALKATTVGSYG